MPDWFDSDPDLGSLLQQYAATQQQAGNPNYQVQGAPGAELPPPQMMPAPGGTAQAPPASQPQPYKYDAFRKRAEELSAGSSGSTAEFQQRIYPQLAREFQGLERFGSKGDKIRLPDGQVIDAVISAGLGGRGYNWGIEQPGGGAPSLANLPPPLEYSANGGGYQDMARSISAPSQPQTPGFQYQPMAAPQDYTPQTVQGPAPLSLGSIGAPSPVSADQVGPGPQVQPGTVAPGAAVAAERVMPPGQVDAERIQGPAALQAQQLQAPGQFSNLTAAQLQLDPSYQFRLQQSLGAIENSAAAKGTLFSPNTIAGIRDTAQQAASQEYAAANARNLGVQQQNFGNAATVAAQNNAANAQAYGLTNQYQQQAALANQQAALQAGQFNVGTGLQAGMFNAGQGQQAQQFNSAQQQQANLANVGNALSAGQFNAAQGQSAALANQGANLQAGQFNAGMNFNTQQQNISNQLAAYNAFQPLNQQNQQFNAGQATAANQQNFQNQFAVNQANNAGGLGQFTANLGAELGRGNLGVSQGQLGLGYGQLALGNRQADQSYDLGLRNNALGYGNLGVSQGQLGLATDAQAYNQGLSTFNTNYGVFRDNRDTAFNQAYSLAQLGAGSAANVGNQAGNLYANQGVANANARMAGAGAWAGALGNIGNSAQDLAYYQATGQPRGGGG